ncbi:MAG: NUDIX hydrolase [Vulcanimicrobiota bacterium]
MEWVDLIDNDNRVVGQAPRAIVRRHNMLHRGIGVLCLDPAGRVYVHQRTATKDLFPSHFDMFVGGVVGAGEDYLEAARREVEEELGVTEGKLEHLFDHLYLGPENRSWIRLYQVVWAGPIRCQPEEIVWGDWMSPGEVVRWAETVPIVADGLELFRIHGERFPQFWG